MSEGKAFLIGDEDVGLCRSKPTRENAFQEDVGIKGIFASKPLGKKRDFPTMADSDLIPGSNRDLTDEVNVAVQSNPVGPRNNVNVSRHFLTS